MIRTIEKIEAECDFCHTKVIFESFWERLPEGWDKVKVGYDYRSEYLDACPICLKEQTKKKRK
jgi:hypothetical protein